MSVLLALDPSVRSAGLALFLDGTLTSAWRWQSTKALDDMPDLGARWKAVARAIYSSRSWTPPDVVVFERPRILSAAKSKGDPNDLIGLAAVGMGVAMCFPAAQLRTFEPSEWTGQIAKATRGNALESARGVRVLSRLKLLERPLVPNQHDVIDAVGLGLHALGRLGIRRANASE